MAPQSQLQSSTVATLGKSPAPNLRIFWRDGTQSDHYFRGVMSAYKWMKAHDL